LIVRTEDKRKKRGEKRGQRTGSEDGGSAKRKKGKNECGDDRVERRG